MTKKHHDTGYKEVFSYPEFVQQLIQGFAPQEIAKLMDFTTLKQHNSHYITPLFEEKLEDVVWSVLKMPVTAGNPYKERWIASLPLSRLTRIKNGWIA